MTAAELVNLVFDGGGSLWIAKGSQDADVAIRHKRAPKAAIQKLRALPREDVIAALEEWERKVRTAREWFFENVMPVSAAKSNLQSLLYDYLEYAKARDCGEDLRYAKQILRPHEVDGNG